MKRRRGPDPERIAEVLVTAMFSTNADAAKACGITERTVERYRARYESDPTVSEIVAKKAAKLSAAVETNWLEQSVKVRGKLLERMEALSATSESLHEVAGAYKIVSEVQIAERVISGGFADDSPGLGFQSGPLAQTATGRNGAVN